MSNVDSKKNIESKNLDSKNSQNFLKDSIKDSKNLQNLDSKNANFLKQDSISLDSKKIAARFYKTKKTYALNTPIQALMRNELIKILKQNLTQKSFKNVFEFGTHCGEYTQLLRQNIESKNYIANDICDYNLRLKGVKTTIFDMNELQNSEIFSQKFDLITSNATLQWLNFDKTLQNLVQILSKNGVILCSSFGEQNLIEIKKTTGYGLQYESLQTIESKLKKYFKNVILSEQFHTLKFKNALEIFRHLKLSGVNSCGINAQNYLLKQDSKNLLNLDSKNAQNYAKKAPKQIIIKKSWLENLEKNFDNKLTYHCIFFFATNFS